jgi:hypothetical protein
VGSWAIWTHLGGGTTPSNNVAGPAY